MLQLTSADVDARSSREGGNNSLREDGGNPAHSKYTEKEKDTTTKE